MHLVELIPTATTQPLILDQLETFLTSVVGKGVVRAKDTPNFIANRVGIFSILAVIAESEKFGLRFDEVDDLTGARLGRAKSATFRTADVVGLDTMAHVIKTMQDTLGDDDPFFPLYETPAVLAGLVKRGALGQKTGAGFYKKEGKSIKVLDPKTGSYVDGGGKADELVGRILKKAAGGKAPAPARIAASAGAIPLGDFPRRVPLHRRASGIDRRQRARRRSRHSLGFRLERRPVRADGNQAGWTQVAQWVKDDIDAGKALVECAVACLGVRRSRRAKRAACIVREGSWSPAEAARFVAAFILLDVYQQAGRSARRSSGETGADPKTYGKTLFETDEPCAPGWMIARARTMS